MKKLSLLILSLMCIAAFGFSEKLAELPSLNDPTNILIDGNELYIFDPIVMKVFSMKDFRLLRQFGKKGEGPGEMIPHPEMPPNIEILKDSIKICPDRKMLYFSKKGEYIKESRIPFMASQIITFGDIFAVVKIVTNSKGEQLIAVTYFSKDMKEIKVVYTRKRETPEKLGKMEIPTNLLYIRAYKDKLYVVDQVKNFRIDVFDKKGNPLKPIEIDYEKIKVTDEYKTSIFDWMKTQKWFNTMPPDFKSMFTFASYLPAIKNFMIIEDKIYVQTSKEKDNKAEFYIFDLNGKVLKHTFIPIDLTIGKIIESADAYYTFKGNKCYFLVDNYENEVWELHSVDIK